MLFHISAFTADADSDEYIIDSRLLNIILIALLAVSFIVNIVLIFCTRRYLKKTRRSAIFFLFSFRLSFVLYFFISFLNVHPQCASIMQSERALGQSKVDWDVTFQSLPCMRGGGGRGSGIVIY